MRCWLLAVVLLLTPVSAFALTEICGNGVDDDASGGDASCPSPDADNDGYTTNGTLLGYDCDDTNRRIFPGAEVTSGCGAGEYKTCQSNGSYTACASTCPSGTCYYVDPTSGNDADSGLTRALGFASLACVSYYASGAPACNVHSALTSGDHIYLLAGTHDDMHAESGYDNVGILLKNKTGITIHFEGAAIIDLPTVANTTAASGIYLDNCDSCIVKGGQGGRLTGIHATDGSSGREKGAITSYGSANVEIHGLQIDNNRGNSNENHGGGFFHEAGGLNFHHNEVFDQITDGGNAVNACLVVLFRGEVGNPARVHHNVLRYTSGATAYCGLKYKHATYNTTWEADHNLISKAPGIGPVAEPSYIHHNTIADADFTNSHICNQDDGAGVMLCDNGGTAFTGASRIEYNTVYHSRGYTWVPNNDWGTDDLSCADCGSFGTLSVKYNVFQDNDAAYAAANAIANIDAYGATGDYTSVITGGLLTENNNCFYNDAAATLQWTLYGASPAGNGDYFTFAQMQSAGYEAAGFSTNPTLTAGTLVATAGSCTGFGWNAGESGGGSGPRAGSRMLMLLGR